jgi:hypothetical protein
LNLSALEPVAIEPWRVVRLEPFALDSASSSAWPYLIEMMRAGCHRGAKFNPIQTSGL